MERFSRAVFGRETLPERCIIYAGAYVPKRKNWVGSVFDEWNRIKGTWVK